MKRRSVRTLFVSWIAYWAVVAVVKLGPPAWAIWSASRTADGNANSVSATMGTMGLKLVVTDHGTTTWAGESPLWAIALWIALFPIVATAVWFARAKDHARVGEPRPTAI